MPLHNHANCKEIVWDNFVRCGHDIKWVCCESIQNLKCEVKIDKYPGSRKCYEDEASL